MLRPCIGFICTFFMLASSSQVQDADKEIKKMQGTWKVALSQVNGKTMPAEAFKRVVVVIQDSKLIFKDNDKVYEEVEFDIDLDAKPKHIDYKYVFGLKKGVRERGIYQWDGEQLTICMAQGGQKRPTEFASKQGVGVQLVKLKRVNP
jgi:uncharacterized protein (TIGR03067 family)